jgi:uncharacterized membrane protein
MAFLIIWVLFATAVGWALATIESKVNAAPKRMKSAILWSVLTGPIGWIVVAARSNLKFAANFTQSRRLQDEVATRALRDDDAKRQLQIDRDDETQPHSPAAPV